MFYSDKFNLLFIASPKSGSTSVEEYLFKIDEKGENHTMTVRGKKFTGEDMHLGTMGHAHAWEIYNAIGAEEYDKLHVFGFVRHPINKLISSYYFSKKLDLLGSFSYVGEKKLWQRRFKGFLSRLSTRILPLNLWALIFPMKTSFENFHDRDGERIVRYLGRTDHLNEDLKIILNTFSVDVSDEIPHANKTTHNGRDHHLKFPPIRNFLEKKYKKDIDLYKTAKKEISKLREEIKER
jgi:hypothetical protein